MLSGRKTADTVCEEEETEREKQRADALAVSDGKT